MRSRRRNREDGEHEVVISVIIAKASITDLELERKKGDLPLAQSFFHCEYKLLPDDREPLKSDLVTFGMAAKLYAENDSKVLRTWLEGNKTWVTWMTSRKLTVTKDVLLQMFKHTVELKVWDTRDKVSVKARFDRPKAFRLPQTKSSDEVDLDIVRELLRKEGKTNFHLGSRLNIFSDCPEQQASSLESKKVTFGDMTPNKELHPFVPSNASSHQMIMPTNESKIEVQVRLDENRQPVFQHLMALASSGHNPLALDTVEEVKLEADFPKEEDRTSRASGHSSRRSNASGRALSLSSFKTRKDDQSSQQIKVDGLARIAIPLSALFTGRTIVSNNLMESVSSLEEVIVILSLDSPLLSEQQRATLNPMVLTVGVASNIPGQISQAFRNEDRYLPPFIMYKFHDEDIHQSEGRIMEKGTKFIDHNVVLLGTKSRGLLLEYLRGPKFRIELHDRDRKEQAAPRAQIFGTLPNDDTVSKTLMVGAKPTKLNPFEWQDKPFDPFGVAEFDLSELLKGDRVLELVSPVRDCQHLDVNNNLSNGLRKTVVENSNAGTVYENAPYLENGTEMKLKVELSISLVDRPVPRSAQSLVERESPGEEVVSTANSLSDECPYGRIVYVFDYNNKQYLKNLLRHVNTINAHALGLNVYPPHVIDAALSTYKLCPEQRECKTLDIITGFQIIDGKYHILVLEGLFALGIQQLWKNVEYLESSGNTTFVVMYNSDMTFSERMYVTLDVDITRIRLYQALDDIVKHPLLYIRDMVPKPCFEAVTKLDQLSKCTSLRGAIRNQLLPTHAMLASLSKEMGVPLKPEDFDEPAPTVELPSSSEKEASSLEKSSRRFVTSRPWTPLDTRNREFDKSLIDRSRRGVNCTNFLERNIMSIPNMAVQRADVATVACELSELPGETAHNYSTQTLNSTELAKNKLRTLLAKEKRLFTYCQDYAGATFVPVDMALRKKEDLHLSRLRFKTPAGFVYPGMKTATASNGHPKRPDQARLDELDKPWRENVLHANILKPSVDRIDFSWDDRGIDFNTWRAPSPFFGAPAPETIHSAGDTLAGEMREVERSAERAWTKKLVVDDPALRTHRCLPATELTVRGPCAANQVSRLQGILKGPAEKYSLSAPGLRSDSIPALSVISNPGADPCKSDGDRSSGPGLERDRGRLEKSVGFVPGPYDQKSWSVEANKIPAKDYEHDYFRRAKGDDFRLVHREHRALSTRPIKPLTEEERHTHLFYATSTHGRVPAIPTIPAKVS